LDAAGSRAELGKQRLRTPVHREELPCLGSVMCPVVTNVAQGQQGSVRNTMLK